MRIVAVDADEGGMRKSRRHALEGEADDNGSVEAYAKFQKQKSLGAGTFDERLITACLMCGNPLLYGSNGNLCRPQVGEIENTCGYAAEGYAFKMV